MGKKTAIQWTDVSWNIARGCHKVDADCKFCYMYRESLNSTRYDPLSVVKTKTVFDLPLRIAEPSKIFTCSLTDFFLPEIDAYRKYAWSIIKRCKHHTFQILTKRPERIIECLPDDWGEGYSNVWLGTSIGSEESIQRVYDLIKVKTKVRFLSLEPLWGEIDLLKFNTPVGKGQRPIMLDINWVITGGESGNVNGKYTYRPCKIDWIEKIVDDCNNCFLPVFVKQLGTHLSKELKLKDRHGGDIDEFPEHLRIREFPIV